MPIRLIGETAAVLAGLICLVIAIRALLGLRRLKQVERAESVDRRRSPSKPKRMRRAS